MLSVYSVEQAERWDGIVRSFAGYDVYYLSGYVRAFRMHGDGEPLLFYYEGEAKSGDEGVRGVNVVMKRDVAADPHFAGKLREGEFFDFATPYGYGGWLIEGGGDTGALFGAYEAWCAQNGIVSEFVRFSLFSGYREWFGGTVKSPSHNVVRDLEMPLDAMWMDFKQKVRKNVKRANSYGLEIILDPDGEKLADFLRIYYGTMDRTDAKDEYYFSEGFFRTLNEMKDNVMYFHAAYEGKIISTELVIYGAENCYSYLGGTDRDYFDMRPNDFLKYEIIKWAKEKGLKRFVLGGGYGSDDGIFEYKKCLAPHGVVDFYIGKKVFDQRVYDQLIGMRGTDREMCEASGFFPQYRA